MDLNIQKYFFHFIPHKFDTRQIFQIFVYHAISISTMTWRKLFLLLLFDIEIETIATSLNKISTRSISMRWCWWTRSSQVGKYRKWKKEKYAKRDSLNVSNISLVCVSRRRRHRFRFPASSLFFFFTIGSRCYQLFQHAKANQSWFLEKWLTYNFISSFSFFFSRHRRWKCSFFY